MTQCHWNTVWTKLWNLWVSLSKEALQKCEAGEVQSCIINMMVHISAVNSPPQACLWNSLQGSCWTLVRGKVMSHLCCIASSLYAEHQSSPVSTYRGQRLSYVSICCSSELLSIIFCLIFLLLRNHLWIQNRSYYP